MFDTITGTTGTTNTTTTQLESLDLIKQIKTKFGYQIANKGPEFSALFNDPEAMLNRVQSLTVANSAGTQGVDASGVGTITTGAGFYENSMVSKVRNLAGTKRQSFISYNNTELELVVCGTDITAEVSTITTGSLTVSMYAALAEACEEVIMQAESPEALMQGLNTILELAKMKKKDIVARAALVAGFASYQATSRVGLPSVAGDYILLQKSVIQADQYNIANGNGNVGTTTFIGRKAAAKLLNMQTTPGEFINGQPFPTISNVNRRALSQGGEFAMLDATTLVVDLGLREDYDFNATTGVIDTSATGNGSPLITVQNANLELATGRADYTASFTPENDYNRFIQSEITLGAKISYGATVYVPAYASYCMITV